MIRLVVLIAWIASFAVACSLSKQEIAGEDGTRCQIAASDTALEVLSRCGLPEEFKMQPKVSEGWFRPKICSAPALVYSRDVVEVGCRGQIFYVGPRADATGLATLGVQDLIGESSGAWAAAAAADLARRSLSDAEKSEVRPVSDRLLASQHEFERRAGRKLDQAIRK